MKIKKVSTVIIAVALLLTLVLVFAACEPKQSAPSKPSPDQTQPKKPEKPVVEEPVIEDPALKNIRGDGGLFLTTIGQSDMAALKNLVNRAGLKQNEYKADSFLDAADVPDGSTVLIVVGASGKGLGAAGTDAAAETARAAAFAEKAGSDAIKIICLHIGGKGRRGAKSDGLIDEVAYSSDVMLIVKTGNFDGHFNDIADGGIPLYEFSKSGALVDPLKYLLGIE